MAFDNYSKVKLARRIAGEIALSDDPSKMLKKWREIFHIPQIVLANYLGLSPSVISDYESGRRKYPGTRMIKRFVEALLLIDEENGGEITTAFERLAGAEVPIDIILDIREFSAPTTVNDICKALGAELLTDSESSSQLLYGYIAVEGTGLLTLPKNALSKLFEVSSKRALIIVNVSTGRSPLLLLDEDLKKPGLVVLHTNKVPDEHVIATAQSKSIPIALHISDSPNSLLQRLKRLRL
ncbi:MAG: helix-turn-helix domain-containing protein [Candidatus Baldrarchaeia archaeon]